TTFNEVDMTEVMALRTEYKDAFEKKYGTRLGFMGFFVKAVCEALKDFPAVNGRVDGKDVIYNDFVHMGIAVGGPKGLVVPVIKDADLMGIHEIEGTIRNFAVKAKNNKLSIDDLT
ncbi:MAG: 2-oxo acid dehydrogenase subunit E2, partial [Bdellovibrionales bacterium]